MLRLWIPTLFLLAAPVAAQSPAQDRPPGARILEVGVRGGVDYDQEAFVAAIFLRVPVDPWRRLALMPGAEIEFLNGTQEWQIDADAVVLLGSRRTLFLGGGPAFRSARYPDAPGKREIRTGYSLVVGFRTAPAPGSLGTQFEFRMIDVDAYEPRVISLGVTWGFGLPF